MSMLHFGARKYFTWGGFVGECVLVRDKNSNSPWFQQLYLITNGALDIRHVTQSSNLTHSPCVWRLSGSLIE